MDVHIVFHHDLPNPDNGSVFLGDLQIDNVQFDGNTYSFENSGQSWQTTTIGRSPNVMPTGSNWTSLAVGSTAERWNVATGNTSSGNTGNLGATAGSYYVYTETSSPVVTGDGFWLRSPLVTLSGSPGNLTFDEGRQGANIGTLRTFVHVVDTNNPDVSIYNPQERVLPNNETSFSAEILGSSGPSGTGTNTTYQIRETSFSGPVVGSAVGQGSGTTKITVSDAPSSRTTKTYYVTAFLTSSGSSTVTSINSFDVRRGGVAPTSAINTVSLATKYISQGSTGGSTGAAFGYRRGDGSTLGDIGNTSSFVTSDGSLSSIWASTSFSARQIVFVTNNPAYHDELRFKVQGNPGNDINWTRLRIADSSTTSTTTGREFKLTDAIYTYDPSLDETTWIWTNDRNENPFASAGEYTAEIVKELNAGYQLNISNTSLTGTQTDSSSAVFSSAERFAQYKIIKTSGTTPGGTADGATVASFAGGATSFTISIGTNDQPSAGQTCNYKVQFKSRYGSDSFVDTTGQNNTFSITRATADSAPVISDVTNDNAAASSVTVTVSLSDNGSGGTGLYYGRASTNNSDNVTTWQTSNTFSQNRGDDFYYFASRQNTVGSGNTLASTGVLEEVDFLLPDRDINFTLTPGNSISAFYAGNVTVNVTDGSPNNRYRALRTTGGNLGCGNTGLIAGTTGTITIGDAANELPVSASSFSYTLQARLGTSSGGDDVTWYTVTSSPSTFTISRSAVNIIPPTISSVTTDDPYSACVTATVNISASGEHGTLEYAQTITNSVPSSGWQSSNTFGHIRNNGRYYWASQDRNTAGTFDSSGFIFVDYKEGDDAPTLAVSPTSLSDSDTSDVTITVSNAESGTTYGVKATSTGAVSLANGSFANDTELGTGTFILDYSLGELPAIGQTVTYEVQYKVLPGVGGDNTYRSLSSTVANRTFSITRANAVAPTIDDVTNDNDASASVQVTVTLSNNGLGGDGLFYGRSSTNNSDNVTSWQTGNTFQQYRGAAFYYFASRSSDTGANNGLASTGVLESVGYIAPDSSISAQNVTFSGSSNATTSVTVLGTTAGDTIEVRINSVPYTIVYGSAVATGSTTVVPVTSGLPTQGNTTTYRLSATRPTSTGGDGLFDISSDTFTITRAADSGPTFTVTYSDTETQFVDITFNFSDEGSGGNGNLYYVADASLSIFPPPFGWSTTPPSSQTRGTTIKYWVSRTSNGSSLNGTFTLNVPILAADRDVGSSPELQYVADTASSATITLHDTSANNLYRVVAFDEQGDVLSESSKSATATTETFTVPLAGLEEGDTLSYTIFGSRPINRGGDGFSLAVNSASTIEVIVDNVEGGKPAPPFIFQVYDIESASVGEIFYQRHDGMRFQSASGAASTATIKQTSACSGNATFGIAVGKFPPADNVFTSVSSLLVTGGEIVYARMQAASTAFTTVEAPLRFGSLTATWRISTGALPTVTYNTTWYGDASNSSFFPTIVSSDIVTGRGSEAAVNCQTMYPGDQLEITVTNGPNSESSNLYAIFSEIGGRFENRFTDVKIDVGQTLTATVADTFTGSIFVRLVQQPTYENRTTLQGVNRIGYIPIHMRMPPVTQDYGMQVLAPNGTNVVIDQDTNVASLETDYTTTTNINAGSSVTITNDDVGDGGFVTPIIPGGLNTEDIDGLATIDINSACANAIVINNYSNSANIANLGVSFIRIF